MNLMDRLKLLVQSTVQGAVRGAVDDLLGEGEPQRTTQRIQPVAGPDTEKLLKQADKRLVKLRDELATALAREKRAEAAWQAAGERSRSLSNEVDALLRADKTDAARDKLAQVKQADIDVMALEKSLRQYAELSTRLKQEMDELEAQLNAVRRRLNQVDEREGHAELTEQQQQAQKANVNAAQKATTEIEQREEQVAKREDQIAAKGEVTDTERMADILKRLKDKK